MARPTMVPLLRRLQKLIGDDLDNPAFELEELQDILDSHREVARYVRLRCEPTPTPGTGTLQFLDFYAECGDWEEGAALFDLAWRPLTATSSDFLTGHWSFATSQQPTVYLSGACYDLYGAAVEALEDWAAKLARDYDFSDKQVSLKRSQAAAGLLAMAARYRSKAWAMAATMVRGDVEGC